MSKQLFFALIVTLLLGGSLSAQNALFVQGTGDLKLKFDGRVTLDGAFYAPAKSLDGVRYGTDDFRLSSSANVSQARLGLWASYGTRWSAKFDVDYSNRRVNLADLILLYHFSPNSYLQMGYYKDPVSMESNMSSRFASVQTPMAVASLTRGERYWGALYVHYSRQHWLGAGLYAGTVGTRTTEANRGDDGYGISAKAAYLPIHNDYTALYLALSGRLRRPEPSPATPSGSRAMSYFAYPESTMDRHQYMGFVLPDVKRYLLIGAEMALKFDKLYFTGEYLHTHFVRNYTHNNVWGWTLTGSYMLRGKQRSYVASHAMFSPLANVTSGGSLELIARIGQLKLNDSNADQPLLGGNATSYMAGINWYPNPNIIIALNYTFTDHDRYADSFGRITGLTSSGLDLHTLQARMQFIF